MKPKYDESEDLRFQFFQRSRRKLILEKITPQANGKGDDRKIVMSFMMPITGERLIGFPQFLKSAYEACEQEGSHVAKAPLETELQLDGVSLEFYSTEDSAKSDRIGLLTNKCLYDFVCEREPDGDTTLTVLRFKLRTKETMGVYGFWVKWGQTKVWADFCPVENALKEGDDKQMTLAESGQQQTEETELAQTA